MKRIILLLDRNFFGSSERDMIGMLLRSKLGVLALIGQVVHLDGDPLRIYDLDNLPEADIDEIRKLVNVQRENQPDSVGSD